MSKDIFLRNFEDNLFNKLILNWDDRFQLEGTFSNLINYYYLGLDCDLLKNDLKKNIKLLSIISFIKNTINSSYLIEQYDILVYIIDLQLDMLVKCGISEPPIPLPPLPSPSPPNPPKYCYAIALKLPIAMRIRSLVWQLFSTLGGITSGGFNKKGKSHHKLIGGGIKEIFELRASDPLAFEKKFSKLDSIKQAEILQYSRDIDIFFTNIQSNFSGPAKLRNLDLSKNGFNSDSLKMQFSKEGQKKVRSDNPFKNSISPVVALNAAIAEARQKPYKDASFNAHVSIASNMIKQFVDIQTDLKAIGIKVDINEPNIVYQLILQTLLYPDMSHPINQCVPVRVLVPC